MENTKINFEQALINRLDELIDVFDTIAVDIGRIADKLENANEHDD